MSNSITSSHRNLQFCTCDFHSTEFTGITCACLEMLWRSTCSPKWTFLGGAVMDVAGPHWQPVSNFKHWKAPPVSKRHLNFCLGKCRALQVRSGICRWRLFVSAMFPLVLLGTKAWGGVRNGSAGEEEKTGVGGSAEVLVSYWREKSIVWERNYYKG